MPSVGEYSKLRFYFWIVYRAISETRKDLSTSGVSTPQELLRHFKFNTKKPVELSKAREIYEESLRLVEKHIEHGNRVWVPVFWQYITFTAQFQRFIPRLICLHFVVYFVCIFTQAFASVQRKFQRTFRLSRCSASRTFRRLWSCRAAWTASSAKPAMISAFTPNSGIFLFFVGRWGLRQTIDSDRTLVNATTLSIRRGASVRCRSTVFFLPPTRMGLTRRWVGILDDFILGIYYVFLCRKSSKSGRSKHAYRFFVLKVIFSFQSIPVCLVFILLFSINRINKFIKILLSLL